MNIIKKVFYKFDTTLSLALSRAKAPLENNRGNEFTEKLGLIITALVLIGMFIASMKPMLTTNMTSIGAKMAALFS